VVSTEGSQGNPFPTDAVVGFERNETIGYRFVVDY